MEIVKEPYLERLRIEASELKRFRGHFYFGLTGAELVDYSWHGFGFVSRASVDHLVHIIRYRSSGRLEVNA
jgi:hypothetical protein